jgi:hypothetical protein
MSPGDFNYNYDMDVRASARTEPVPAPRPLVRRRPLSALLAELHGVQGQQNGLLAAGDVRRAAELSGDVDRLTREYVARRDAPPVRLPF